MVYNINKTIIAYKYIIIEYKYKTIAFKYKIIKYKIMFWILQRSTRHTQNRNDFIRDYD